MPQLFITITNLLHIRCWLISHPKCSLIVLRLYQSKVKLCLMLGHYKHNRNVYWCSIHSALYYTGYVFYFCLRGGGYFFSQSPRQNKIHVFSLSPRQNENLTFWLSRREKENMYFLSGSETGRQKGNLLEVPPCWRFMEFNMDFYQIITECGNPILIYLFSYFFIYSSRHVLICPSLTNFSDELFITWNLI